MQKVLTALLVTSLMAATALSCPVTGRVSCPNDITFGGIVLTITDASGKVLATVPTSDTGLYGASLYVPDTVITVTIGNLPDGIVQVKYSIDGGPYVEGTAAQFTLLRAGNRVDWLVDGPACGSCWMTGGGAYVDPLLQVPVATHGGSKTRPQHAFGGNVYPGCSPTAGDGGNWNHVARGTIKLHFHGTDIEVVQCGNVAGIPEGSTSPVTLFNFIEFRGTGTLKGIAGRKADFGTVNFFARVEDRNEPGSNGQRDGALVDRYYLRVYSIVGDQEIDRLVVSSTGGSVGDPADLVFPITDGNLQLHCSSCDNPPQ